jgi:serine/threonine protein phosphatase 1
MPIPPLTLTSTDWIEHPISLGRDETEIQIGDFHGLSEHMVRLRDAMLSAFPDAHTTFIGDSIDRGPNSLDALMLLSGYVQSASKTTWLPGNHEQMLLAMLNHHDERVALHFLQSGGGWFFELFDWDSIECAAALRDKLGFDLLEHFSSNALHREVGNVIIVHAGVSPDAEDPAAWIKSFDLMTTPCSTCEPLWIREDFHDYKGAYGCAKQIIHGHTPERRIKRGDTQLRPEIGYHRFDGARLGLDGGSFKTGCITGAVLKNGAYKIYTVRSE